MKVSVFYRRSPKAKAPGVGALYVVLVILAFVAVAYIAAVKRAEQQRATAEGSAAMPALQAPAGQAGQALEQGAVALRSEGNAMAEMQEGSGAAAETAMKTGVSTGEQLAKSLAAAEQGAVGAPDHAAAYDDTEVVAAMAEPAYQPVQELPVAKRSFFDEARMERAAARAKHEETLMNVLDDPAVGAEARNRAQQALMEAAEVARLEELAETMLRTWGVDDALVIIGEAGASAAVKSGRLDRTAASAIGDIVHRATGVELSRITIVERDM